MDLSVLIFVRKEFVIFTFCLTSIFVYGADKDGGIKSPEFKINSPKHMSDIFNIILNSKNFSNRSGYIIQARSDPKRLIFISEKLATASLSKSTERPSSGRKFVDGYAKMAKSTVPDAEISFNEKPPAQNINLHLHLTDPDNLHPNHVYNWIYKTFEGEGRLKKRSFRDGNNGRKEPEMSEDASQSMKRVIFIRCPFYACPRGHICDYHTRSCRPVYYPDFDY